MINKKYPEIKLLDENVEQWIKVIERSESGYATQVEIGDTIITGKEVRGLFDLRSSFFDVEYNNGQFIFKVKGYGHGVGLSQYGADYMGRQGSTHKEILEHYYKNSVLISIK